MIKRSKKLDESYINKVIAEATFKVLNESDGLSEVESLITRIGDLRKTVTEENSRYAAKINHYLGEAIGSLNRTLYYFKRK